MEDDPETVRCYRKPRSIAAAPCCTHPHRAGSIWRWTDCPCSTKTHRWRLIWRFHTQRLTDTRQLAVLMAGSTQHWSKHQRIRRPTKAIIASVALDYNRKTKLSHMLTLQKFNTACLMLRVLLTNREDSVIQAEPRMSEISKEINPLTLCHNVVEKKYAT